MVLGVLLILLVCAANAGIVLLPGLIAYVIAEILLAFLRKIKLRSESFEQTILTICSIGSLFFAASLQLHIWQLIPGEEALQWSMAQLTFVLGTGVVFLFRIHNSDTPARRAWISVRFLAGVFILSGTLAAAFHHSPTFDFVNATPGRVSKFIFGEFKSSAQPTP